MHHNNCLTKNYAHFFPTQTHQLGTCMWTQPYLFTFVQLKQLPKLFDLFVKHNLNAFVFDRKQFAEITHTRNHKHVSVVWPSENQSFSSSSNMRLPSRIGLSSVLCPRTPTQYRLYGRQFLQVKRPNQQYQSTEGRS